MRKILLILIATGAALQPVLAQPREVLTLTMEETVNRALNNSYRVRQLELSIEQTQSWLAAERASLKSRVYMNLTAPDFEAVSNNLWNANLQRYELIRENNRRWQMDFSIQQPVVLFGYPTNGYLSLNNRVYRYAQLNGSSDVRYYNRYFVKYEQPLFQPNRLKNDIEEAELNLSDSELRYREDIVDMVDDVADDYFDLFEIAYQQGIYREQIDYYERAVATAREIAEEDTVRSLELSQITVELANVRERLNQAQSSYRLESSRLAQRLRLELTDSIVVLPTTHVTPIPIDEEVAIRYAMTIRPQLQRLQIRKRRDEIDIDEARGWDAFRVNLEATYGREVQDPRLDALWDHPSNSYTVGLRAYVPLWDWGRRRYRVQAEKIALEKTDLYIEETEKEILSDIENAVQNLREFQERAMTMQENLQMATTIAESSLSRYGDDRITVLELLQSFRRQEDTAQNFLRAYLGYRNAILSLQTYTHYDFEHDMPLFERFKIADPRGM